MKNVSKVISLMSIMLIPMLSFSQGKVASTRNIISTEVGTTQFMNIATDGNRVSQDKTPIQKYLMIDEISLYGAGNILGLVTASEDIEENAAPTGSIGLNMKSDKLTIDLFYSLNAKQKVTINTLAQFGNTLINPNIGGHAFTLHITGQYNQYVGFQSSFRVSDNIYVLNEEEIDASPIALRFGGYVRPFTFPDSANGNEIQVSLSLDFTHRNVLGDFRNVTREVEGKTLGRSYNSLDLTLSTYLNDVRIYAQGTFSKKGDFLIPGYSGAQITLGLDVSGDLISLK